MRISSSRLLVVGGLVFVTAVAASLALSAPASADRCQPEELVTGPGTSPIPEEQDPRCAVMDGFVYPNLDCDSTTLNSCVTTLDAEGTVYLASGCGTTKQIACIQYCPVNPGGGGGYYPCGVGVLGRDVP